MSNAGMSDAEQIVSEKLAEEGVAAAGWAQSAARQIGSRLKETGAKLQKATKPPTDSSFKASSAAETERPATKRAEESLDQAGEQIGIFAAALSRQVRRSVALAREGAEDVLAEAQSFRQKSR